jgi:photosystem II stability/assembly factor-like uncharacterized protein
MTPRILYIILVIGTAFLQTVPLHAQLDSSNTWVSTALAGGPHTVHSVTVDPDQPDTIFAGTTPGSIYRSLNTTSTWAEITNAGTTINEAVYGVTFNPDNRSVVWAGSHSTGIFKSVDRGVTWAATSLTGPFTTWDIVFDPSDTTRMYAPTGLTLYHSSDAGATWVDARIDTVSGVNALGFAVMPLSPDTLLVGVPTDGIYRSVDRGSVWALHTSGLTDLDLTALVASPEFAATAYATTTGGGIFVTSDAGSTWTAQNTGITNLNIESIAVSPSNPTVMYAGSDNGEIFKSPDRGLTWLEITLDLGVAAAVNDLFVHPDSANVLYAGLDDIYRLKQAGLDSVSFFPTGTVSDVIGAFDVDADSIADLVTANVGAQSIQVMLNGSQGATFTTTSYATGAEPTVIGAGDLEGDGDQDLIVGNRLQQTVAILFNDSTGTFATPTEIFVGRPVTEMVIADMDTDQDIDIAVTDDAIGTIAIYQNDGLGSFGAPKLITGPVNATSMVGGDFNGDGITDLLVSSSDGSVTLLRNLGNASFQIEPSMTLSGTPTHLQAGDFDIDGDVDFAAAASDQTVRIWRNQGDGSFGDSSQVALADTVTSLTAVDLDEDGYLDLLAPLPNGQITVLINDANGAFTDTTVVGVQTALGVGTAGDLDGDAIADLALVRPTDNGLLFYDNPIPQNIKLPVAPRDLVAMDTQSDLGGRVTLTWRRPNVDETTGRVTMYEIMRATTEAGPYTHLSSLDTSATNVRDSVFVSRTYIDTSATVGTTHYYYILSENGGGTQSSPSDTVNAASAPQPFFDFQFLENSPFHVQDTIEVTARLTSIDHDPAGLSLFVDYDTRALTLLDANSTDAGIQPFEIDSTLSTEAIVLQNRVDTTSTSGTGKVDLTFGFLPDLGAEAVALGTFRFVTQRDTTTRIRVVNDTSTVRQSALTDSVGALILPFISPATQLVIQNHKVRGSLAFQGRTDNLDMSARFDLTQHDSLGTGAPLPDSVAYRPPNDLDLTESGIQLLLATDGSFTLEQVPGGTYGLFVKTFHYLRTRISTDSLLVNDSTGVASNVDFTWVGIDTSVTWPILRAGDANDDNQVDLADFGLLGSNFGSSGFAVNSPGWSADFNGDGIVSLVDFGLLQSNFGETGLGPSVATKPVASQGKLFVLQGEEGSGYVIHARDAGVIRGFSADVVVSESHSDALRSEITGLAFFDSGKTLELTRTLSRGADRILRVAAVFSDGGSFSGDGELFSLDLGDLSTDEIRIERVQFLDPAGSVIPGIGSPINVIDAARPLQTKLHQNIPNPFNPATLIPYEIGAVTDVRLIVYSTLGQEIRVLVDGPQEIGRYEVSWDGRDHAGHEVASGVYLYRFQAGRHIDVRKAVLLR